MGDQHTSTTTLDNQLAVYLEKRGLRVLKEDVVMKNLISPENKYSIPRQMGTQITFTAWTRIAAASSTLSEASSNSAVTLSSRKVNKTIVSLGRAVKYTDLVKKTAVLDVDEGALMQLEQSAALSVDNAIQRAVFQDNIARVGRDASTANANKLLSAFGSSVGSAFAAAFGDNGNAGVQHQFQAVIAGTATRFSAIKRSSAGPTSSAIMGPYAIRQGVRILEGYSSEPFGDGKHRGCMHTDAWSDMLGNPMWKEWKVNFSDGAKAMEKHEAGEIHNVRFWKTSNLPKYVKDNRSLYLSFICGRGALGLTDLGDGLEYIITKPGPQSTNDPFHLNSYVAYKVRVVAAALNPSAGVILVTSKPKSV